MDDWRVDFDVEITFLNGGRLVAEGFKLDVPGPDVDDARLAELVVRHLGLLMVDQVVFGRREVVREPHRGGRGTTSARGDGGHRRIIDLSHPIRSGMVTYPGLPGPEITDHLARSDSAGRYAPGTTFQIGRISMVANTGTYLDSPFHRFADGADLGAVPLATMVDLPAVVVHLDGSDVRRVDQAAVAPFEVEGRAVLVHTGWDRYWGTDEYGDAGRAPFLTEAATTSLIERGAVLVGIDSVNIDDMADGRRPAHTSLLAAGVPIVEHLRGMADLPAGGFRFHAAPPAVEGMGTFTVRAYAVVGSS
jgi:kynurenine formamidase